MLQLREERTLGFIGRDVPRLEDDSLLRGAARFVPDLIVPGRLDAAFARSPVAHGRLHAVDVSAAEHAPGVAGVFDADRLGLPDLGFPPRVEAPDAMKRPVLARERLRYVGEPFALVVADTRYAAEDAAEHCAARVEAMDPVLDVTGVAAAPPLFEGSDNVAYFKSVGEPVDDVFRGAPIVVETEFDVGRVAHTSLEGRAILAIPSGDGLDVWCSTQTPHRLRGALARSLALDQDRVRVRVPYVGGAFGGKSQTYPEYLAVARAAVLLQRPVRWVEDRHEALVSASHGRGQVQTVRLAADSDGRLLAADVRLIADLGAYPHDGGAVPHMTLWVISGCYAIPRLYAEGRGVVTNKTPTASYRGAGRPEAAHAIERTMDVLAARLGMDPAELRLRNFVAPNRFPYKSATGALYDSGDYPGALRLALEAVDYDRVRRDQASRRNASDERALGVGISSYIERSGGQLGSNEWGRVELIAGGRVRALSPTTSQGQGNQTGLVQIVADAFDVPMDRIDLVQGDTQQIARGTGTFGSRSIQVGGGALLEASAHVLEEARAVAGEILTAPTDSLSYRDGSFYTPDSQVSLAQVVERAGELAHELEYSPPQAFPFGTHVAVVEVDRATGRVDVVKLVTVDDCGRVLNPLLAKGQAVGSAVQGLGQALYEQVPYFLDGKPAIGSLIDYSIPTLAVTPPIDALHSVTPNPNIPLGVKGAGEAGCIGVPPAVANAVADALGSAAQAGLDFPLTPERVWRAGLTRGPE